MIEHFEKRYTKLCKTRIIIFAVLIAGLVGFGIKPALTLINGARHIDEFEIRSNAEGLKGEYIEADIWYVLGCYFEEITTTTTYGVKTNERTSQRGYAVLGYDEQHDENFIYGLLVKPKLFSKMDELEQATWDEFDGFSYVEEPYTVKGKLAPMKKDELGYLRQSLYNVGLSDIDAVYYAIDTDLFERTYLIIAGIAAAAFLICLIFNVVGLTTDKVQKQVDKFLGSNRDLTLSDLEADFSHAQFYGRDICVGDKYVFNPNTVNLVSKISEIAWAYYYASRYFVGIKRFGVNGELPQIPLTKKNANKVLADWEEKHKFILIGYNKKLNTLYKKNRQEFLDMKYNPNKTSENADSYMSFMQ